MKSGLHDKSLLSATSEANIVFWKGADENQLINLVNQAPHNHNIIESVELFADELKGSIINERDVIVMMSNGSFDGLVDLLKSKL